MATFRNSGILERTEETIAFPSVKLEPSLHPASSRSIAMPNIISGNNILTYVGSSPAVLIGTVASGEQDFRSIFTADYVNRIYLISGSFLSTYIPENGFSSLKKLEPGDRILLNSKVDFSATDFFPLIDETKQSEAIVQIRNLINPSPSPGSPAPTVSPTQGLYDRSALVWRFDDNTWTASKPASGYNLTATGTVAIDTPLSTNPVSSGFSARFNGSSYLRLNTSLLGFGPSSTIAFTYQNTLPNNSTGNCVLVGKYNTAANQRSWMVWLDCNTAGQEILKLSFSADGNPGTTLSTSLFSRGGKHFVAIQRSVSGKFIRMIVDNGSYISSANTSVFNSTAPFMIGAALTGTNSAAGSFFTGAIDNVVFWNEILTANDLSLVWNSGNVLQV